MPPEQIMAKLPDALDGDCWHGLPKPGDWREYVKSPMDLNNLPAGEKYRECIFAPGDFTLLSREFYFHIRGYPELALPTQLDDVPVWQAVAAGKALIVLPRPAVTWHINHGKGYNNADDRWSQAETMKQAYRLEEAGRRMMASRHLEILNDYSWGLPHHTLQEVTF